MSAARLTKAQAQLLEALAEYTDAPTTRRLADKLESPAARREYWGYDRTHAVLKRLARRGLVVVRDARRPQHWHVTAEGRDALAARQTENAAA